MKTYRTILSMVVGLAVFMLACGEDVESTRLSTATPRGPAATAVPAIPAAEVVQPAAPAATPTSTTLTAHHLT